MPLTRCLFVVWQMASFLRRSPYMVNLLLGGVDEAGPALYFIDYMGALVKQDFAIHGHGSMFLYSLMDRHWKVRRAPPWYARHRGLTDRMARSAT